MEKLEWLTFEERKQIVDYRLDLMKKLLNLKQHPSNKLNYVTDCEKLRFSVLSIDQIDSELNDICSM